MIIGLIEGNKVTFGTTECGFVYKNYDAFNNKTNEICYIPEYGLYTDENPNNDEIDSLSSVYTYQDFIDLAKEHIKKYELSNHFEELAEDLFENLYWQDPSTLLNEWGDDLENE